MFGKDEESEEQTPGTIFEGLKPLTDEEIAERDALLKKNVEKNKEVKPLTEAQKIYLNALQGGYADKGNPAVIQALKSRAILDINGELTEFGKSFEV